MSPATLRERFHERVDKARTETFVLAVGTGALAVVAVVVLAAVLAICLVWQFGMTLPMPYFVALFTLLFFGLGWIQYSRGQTSSALGEKDWTWHLPPTARYLAAGDLGIVTVFLLVPGLLFHLVAQVFESRNFFQTEEAEALALRLLTAAPHVVPEELLETASAAAPGTFRRALALLLHLAFVRRQTIHGREMLLLTSAAETFLEEAGFTPAEAGGPEAV